MARSGSGIAARRIRRAGAPLRPSGAEAHADSVGVVDWSLNLTVDGDTASAVFVAVTNEPLPTIPRP